MLYYLHEFQDNAYAAHHPRVNLDSILSRLKDDTKATKTKIEHCLMNNPHGQTRNTGKKLQDAIN